jgi:hypothetical protein
MTSGRRGGVNVAQSQRRRLPGDEQQPILTHVCRTAVAGTGGECHNERHVKEIIVIRYMGTRKNADGAAVYVFIVNGLEKEVREHALKQHPGCYEALPAAVKAKIAANRAWLSKL